MSQSYSHIVGFQRLVEFMYVFLEHGAFSNKIILKDRSDSTFFQVKPKCTVDVF